MLLNCIFSVCVQNSTPIPPKSAEQTKAILLQFPVSSGQHHRANESEWVPVQPKKPVKRNISSHTFEDNLNDFRELLAANKQTEKQVPAPPSEPATPKVIEPAIEVNIFKEAGSGKVN